MIFMVRPQSGQSSGSAWQIRLMSMSQRRRSSRADGADGRLLLLGAAVAELVPGGAGLVGSHGAGLVGVVAVVADKVFTLVGDVLDQFSEEVQGSQNLEVAGRGTKEVRVAGSGEADHTGKAERASGHVLVGQAFDALAFASGEVDASVDAEAAVSPGSDLGDHGGLNPVLVQEQTEDVVLPESKERVVAEVLRKWEESAAGGEVVR